MLGVPTSSAQVHMTSLAREFVNVSQLPPGGRSASQGGWTELTESILNLQLLLLLFCDHDYPNIFTQQNSPHNHQAYRTLICGTRKKVKVLLLKELQQRMD